MRFIPIAFVSLVVLILATLNLGCDSDKSTAPSASTSAEVRFTLTPTVPMGNPYSVTKRYKQLCVDRTTPECPTNYYEQDPDVSGCWMSFPRSATTCADFLAIMKSGDLETTFIGTVQRGLGVGTGPFATGTYTIDSAFVRVVEVGSFDFEELELRSLSGPYCDEL